ncbi:MAG: nickel-dependent lactate racemase [Bacteroidales bacterium]|nr:nickel-dependent lactate racemase [Bacteroidales bacterium]
MEISLAYGKTRLPIRIPDQVHTEVVEPRFVEGLQDQIGAVQEALAHPIHHPPLQASVRANEKVAIVFSDITRATPYDILVPPLLKALSHLPKQNITFLGATGTHRPATHEELCTILGTDVVDQYRIVQNDASDQNLHQHVGTTRAGNEVYLNKEILEYDLRILTGFIEPHFFAGFSGGGKALMPGMAHVDTIRYNHSIRNLEDPRARWGRTIGNPLWEEVLESSEFASPLFLLNITLNRNKKITGIFAGDLREAHKQGCAFAKESAMAGLDQPFDIVITTNSGYPLDLNVYQSVKGMSAAEQVVKKGGSIITVAECWDGVPAGSDYETILHSVSEVEELMEFIRAKERQLKDTWQVFFQAMIQMKSDVYLYSTLDNKTVERALLKPINNLDQLVLELVKKYGRETRICVLPEGPQAIPYLK